MNRNLIPVQIRCGNVFRTIGRGFIYSLALATLVGFSGNVGSAQAPKANAAGRPSAPYLLPDSTVVFARVTNALELRERFSRTAVGQIITDPEMRPLVTELYNVVNSEVERIKEQLGVSLPELLQIPQGEVSFALVAPEKGRVSVVFMIEVGEQAANAKKILAKVRERRDIGEPIVETIGNAELRIFANPNANPNNEDPTIQAEADVEKKQRRVRVGARVRGNTAPEFCYFEHQGVIGLTDSREIARAMLSSWNGEQLPTLAGNATFTSIMNRCLSDKDGAPQVTFFVDPISLAKRATQGNFQASAVFSILGSLGINGIKGFGGSMTFAPTDYDGIFHFHLALDNPRTGLLELLAIRDGDTTPESWVPNDVESYLTAYWDVSQTFSAVSKLFNTFNGEGALSDLLKRNLSDQIGVDVEEEVLPAIDGRVTVLSWIQRPVTLNSQASMVAVRLKDVDAFRPIVDRFLARFPDRIETRTYRGVKMMVLKEPLPVPNGNDPGFRPPQPCGILLGDYVLVSNSPKFMEHLIDTQVDMLGSLADELDFKLIASKIRRQIGGNNPGMIMFNRPEEGMRAMYELATSELGKQKLAELGQGNPFLGNVDRAFQANPLPPFASIAKYLAPGGGLVTSDETGIHYMNFSLRREK